MVFYIDAQYNIENFRKFWETLSQSLLCGEALKFWWSWFFGFCCWSGSPTSKIVIFAHGKEMVVYLTKCCHYMMLFHPLWIRRIRYVNTFNARIHYDKLPFLYMICASNMMITYVPIMTFFKFKKFEVNSILGHNIWKRPIYSYFGI